MQKSWKKSFLTTLVCLYIQGKFKDSLTVLRYTHTHTHTTHYTLLLIMNYWGPSQRMLKLLSAPQKGTWTACKRKKRKTLLYHTALKMHDRKVIDTCTFRFSASSVWVRIVWVGVKWAQWYFHGRPQSILYGNIKMTLEFTLHILYLIYD